MGRDMSSNRDPRAMQPNRSSRVRVYDAYEAAAAIRERFQDAPVVREEELPFGWPSTFQHVGDSLAVAYGSNKWKDDPVDMELYKHIAESRNRVFAVTDFFYRYDDPAEQWPVIGPMIAFDSLPLPRHYAKLGDFYEANLKLHTHGMKHNPMLGPKDDGCVTVVLKDAELGAGVIRWSAVEGEDVSDQPFLFVYDKTGVKLFIVGKELDVQGVGIVG